MRYLLVGLVAIMGLASTTAHAQTQQPIYFDSHCTQPLRVLVSRQDADGYWFRDGWFHIPPGKVVEGSSHPMVRRAGEPQLRHDPAKKLYIYAETTSGARRVWSGTVQEPLENTYYGFREAAVRPFKGRQEIHLVCSDQAPSGDEAHLSPFPTATAPAPSGDGCPPDEARARQFVARLGSIVARSSAIDPGNRTERYRPSITFLGRQPAYIDAKYSNHRISFLEIAMPGQKGDYRAGFERAHPGAGLLCFNNGSCRWDALESGLAVPTGGLMKAGTRQWEDFARMDCQYNTSGYRP